MEFEQVIARRRMVRNYTDESVDEAVLDRIMVAARRAPSAGFSQGQSFVVVTEEGRRKEIAELAGESKYVEMGLSPWISRAPVIVTCCVSKKVYIERYREPDKQAAGMGEEELWPIPYWWVDSGASMMLLLLAAVNEGLAAGFCGMSEQGYTDLKKLLEIPTHVTPIGLVTIGHPAPDKRSGSLDRGWKPEDEVIHKQSWGS